MASKNMKNMPSMDSILSDEKSMSPDQNLEENGVSCYHISFCNVLPIFHPYQKFKMIWDFFVIVTLTISCWEIPFALAFDLPVTTDDAIGIIRLLIDVFLCCDIVITFRTAFYDKFDPLRLITCPIAIAKRYLRFWFWFDLITSFPFDYVMGGYSQGFAHYFKILRLIRLIRVLRIIKVIKLLSATGGKLRLSASTTYKLRIFKIMFSMAFVAHLFACLWFAVGNWMIDEHITDDDEGKLTWVQVAGLDDPDITLVTQYSTSMYWSVITLFTTGITIIIYYIYIYSIYCVHTMCPTLH